MRPDRQLLADAIRIQIDELMPTHAVTLSFNRRLPAGQAAQTVKHLAAMLDRELLGPRWKNKSDLRTKGICVPEHEDSNLHFHSVLRVHPSVLPKFEALLKDTTDPLTGQTIQTLPLWLAVYRPGSSCIKTYASSGWSDYMTKAITEQTSDNTVYL